MVHTHASRAPSFLMFPRLYSLFFSRMLCCDTPMTLGLGFSRAAAAWILTRNRGSRMNGMEMNTSQAARGRARLAAQEEPSISRCVCAVAR